MLILSDLLYFAPTTIQHETAAAVRNTRWLVCSDLNRFILFANSACRIADLDAHLHKVGRSTILIGEQRSLNLRQHANHASKYHNLRCGRHRADSCGEEWLAAVCLAEPSW